MPAPLDAAAPEPPLPETGPAARDIQRREIAHHLEDRRHRRPLHVTALMAASLLGAAHLSGTAAAAAERLRLTEPWDGGGMVSAVAAGEGRRVIFVHGTPGSSGAWDGFLEEVPEGFEYVAIDRPGFGATTPADAVPSLEAQARALAPFLETDGPPPILVGHSLGGPVVAMAAALYPDLIGGLVIVAGSLDPDLEEVHFLQPMGEWWPVVHLLPRNIRNANRELLVLEAELRRLSARLGGIGGPVEIVHGTEDNLVPFENVAFMERMMGAADLEITVLRGANHFLPWNAQATIEAAIRRVAGKSAESTD